MMTIQVRAMRCMVSRPPLLEEPGVTNVVGGRLLFVAGTDVVEGVIGNCNRLHAGCVPSAIALWEVPGVLLPPLLLPPCVGGGVGVGWAIPLLASIVGEAVICQFGPPSPVRAYDWSGPRVGTTT